MPKNKRFESFKYRFLVAAQSIAPPPDHLGRTWNEFLLTLVFRGERGAVAVSWPGGPSGGLHLSQDGARFYPRGDSAAQSGNRAGQDGAEDGDPIRVANARIFREAVLLVARAAGFDPGSSCPAPADRIAVEREFHDQWAGSVDVSRIDVRRSNEACTAPEMRHIVQRLGDLKGRKLLDVGCGLGEASVYFALQGAEVTASDLSPGMLEATCQLAHGHGVSVTPHLAAAEDLQLPPKARFDVIYAGNLLHHVDIEATLRRVKPHLKPGGLFVSWDPLAYNPAINVYRKKAMDVRTEDEHPLTLRDIRLFKKYFSTVETRYFWLTTLVIFVIMALVQRRNPNKERFWKTVVDECDRWAPLYRPLELLDRLLLRLLPPLRLLCWNVVIIAQNGRG
jgi:SAM-dependent methyltransferase